MRLVIVSMAIFLGTFSTLTIGWVTYQALVLNKPHPYFSATAIGALVGTGLMYHHASAGLMYHHVSAGLDVK